MTTAQCSLSDRYLVGFSSVVNNKATRKVLGGMMREDPENAVDPADSSVSNAFTTLTKYSRHWSATPTKGLGKSSHYTSLVCSAHVFCIDTSLMSILANNIEHFIERTAAFVVIVLGEVVLSVVYHATGDQIGFKRFVTKSQLGVMTNN